MSNKMSQLWTYYTKENAKQNLGIKIYTGRKGEYLFTNNN